MSISYVHTCLVISPVHVCLCLCLSCIENGYMKLITRACMHDYIPVYGDSSPTSMSY